MTASTRSSFRLTRLLSYVAADTQNASLRQAAVREACEVGHWDTARQLLDAGLQLHPEDAELLALSGFVHLQAQRYVDAGQALSSALALGLNLPEPRYNLAFALFMQKRHAEALDHLVSPTLSQAVPLALRLRARCLHHLNRPTEAIADCRAHLEVEPDDAETHGLLGLLLFEQDQSEEAQAHVKAALRRNPKQPDAMLALASLQSDAQDHDAAQNSYNALLQVDPACGRAWLGLGLLELNRQQVAAAQQDIELAATHMPEHIGTWHVLAWIKIMIGDVATAERAFGRALALDRNFGETHGGLAVVAAMQGREAEARVSIKRALRLDSHTMSAQYAEWLLLQHHGRHDDARALLDAFLARPAARSHLSYRDLVAAHMTRLHASARQAPDSGVRH